MFPINANPNNLFSFVRNLRWNFHRPLTRRHRAKIAISLFWYTKGIPNIKKEKT